MTKRVELTGQLLQLLKEKTGDDNFDVSKVVAYESIAASTRPLKQRNSPYDKAVMSRSVLSDAADILANTSVPLLVMHKGEMLPIGQCLDAGVVQAEQDHHELRVVFYLEESNELVSKLDNGIVDEVSVGMLAEHAYCSECDFDYMKPENMYNFWLRSCDNDHVLGQDGTHLRLSGCSSWSELSLVGKGASNNAKIVNRAQQRLSTESYQKLAASGQSPDLVYLLCSSSTAPQVKLPSNLEANEMELTQLITELSTEKAQVISLKASEQALSARAETLTTENAELKLSVDTLTSKVATLEANDAVAALATANEQLTAAQAFIKTNWELALRATGKEVPTEAPTSAEMITQLEAAQVQLAAIPRNGVSHGLGHDDGVVQLRAQAQASAYQSRK